MKRFRYREIGRARKTCQVCVTRRVDRDRTAVVLAVAAEIGRVDEGCASGVYLRDENVLRVTAIYILNSARTREVGRIGIANHVRVARRIDGDAVCLIVAAAAEIGRIDDHRIDDQRVFRVILADVEANAECGMRSAEFGSGGILHDILACDLATFAVDLLIRVRLFETHFSGGSLHHQIAGLVDINRICSCEVHRNPRRISSRTDDKVILELPLIAVILKIDAGINTLVFDP